ncbi:MAG TPA: alpha/beta hydrolase [Anaeromyxobacteraceae bacterium]|nr:alpha/beta hydrolase [Anaeromyxobacteraceae bacterium]
MQKLLLAVAVVGLGGCLDPAEDGNLVPRTADEDPSIPQLSFNGSTFHVEAFGDPSRPVIIVLHGGPGGDYRGLLRLRDPVDGVRLEDRHLLVFWDQRGTGLSQRHAEGEITLDAYDRDLGWIIDHFSPGRPVVLLGHSWGGMYATRYISLHPEKVAGAVLMEPGPLTGALFSEIRSEMYDFDPVSEWLNDYAWAQSIVGPDGHARADYLRGLASVGDIQPGYHASKTDREPFWRHGAVAAAAITAEGIVDGEPVWNFVAGLDRFTAPVLFEASEENTVIGIEFQKKQMPFYPNASLAVIAGAGHDFPWTRAAETVAPVLAYLDAIAF